MKLLTLVLVALTGIAVSAAGPLDADTTVQTPAAAQSADGLRFASVTLKPNRTNPGPMSFEPLANGGYRIVNDSVHRLIELAYPGAAIDRKSEPDWLWNERYDLSATSPLTGTATREQRQAMMRTLLEERFNFKAHLDSRQEPAYDLVLARTDGQLGPGLQPSSIDCAALTQDPGAVQLLNELRRITPFDAPPPPCMMRTGGIIVEGDMRLTDPIGLLSFIRSKSGRPVIDKTGLTGSFRVHLVADRLAPPGTTTDVDGPPDIFSALPDQLGLKLEASERTVYTVIVDRVERPAAN